jgi:hypothetical protein
MDAKIKECGTCDHGNNKYSLTLNIENAHVSMGTYCWDLHSGYVIDLSIFDMTVENMYELANKIFESANKISNRGL